MARAVGLPDDRDDRDVVQFGVVQAVEQVDRAGTGGGHADAEAAGELRVADRFERAHLLVPGLDEHRVVVGAAPGGEDAVDAVAGEGEDLVHSPVAQSLEQVVGDGRFGHRCPPWGSPSGQALAGAADGGAGQPVGGPGGDGHDGQGWVGAALGGQHAAVGDVEVGYGEGAAVGVDDAMLFVRGHPRSADEVGVPVDGDHLVGPGRAQDVFHHGLRGLHQLRCRSRTGSRRSWRRAVRAGPSPRPG